MQIISCPFTAQNHLVLPLYSQEDSRTPPKYAQLLLILPFPHSHSLCQDCECTSFPNLALLPPTSLHTRLSLSGTTFFHLLADPTPRVLERGSSVITSSGKTGAVRLGTPLGADTLYCSYIHQAVSYSDTGLSSDLYPALDCEMDCEIPTCQTGSPFYLYIHTAWHKTSVSKHLLMKIYV